MNMVAHDDVVKMFVAQAVGLVPCGLHARCPSHPDPTFRARRPLICFPVECNFEHGSGIVRAHSGLTVLPSFA